MAAGEAQRELQLLFEVYQNERRDNATASQILVGIVAAVLAFIAVVLAGLGSRRAEELSPWMLGFAPTIPVLLITWASLYLADAGLRRCYLKALERNIRTGQRDGTWGG